MKMSAVHPVATVRAKSPLAFHMTLTHMTNMIMYSPIRIRPPTKPVSSM